MSAAGDDRTSGDPIGEYLDQLRAGLRVSPDEAELIVAEAEDHLRETAAAGLAVGMTEREAQEAAISVFGPVPAVVHAHQTRGGRTAAVAGDAAAATWKLASLLVVATGVGGLAADAVRAIFRMPQPAVIMPSGAVPHSVQHPPIHFMVAVTAAVCGAILLTGFSLVRRRQQRRGRLRGPLVGGAFPAVAAGFFCAVVLALLALAWSGPGVASFPGLFIVAYLALAIGYAVRAARMLRRRGRRQGGPGQAA
ncbi:MAG TPA: hypothetical protein VME19_12055 [Streptosporangiaceae bacterium]|nr:hypothetical protein [Streptosporangiaceae bacterium]